MGIIQKKEFINPNRKLVLWKIEETLEKLIIETKLTKEEEKWMLSLTKTQRKKEFLVTRLILQTIMGKQIQIGYTKSGKPYIINNTNNISISHKNQYVALYIGSQYKIAIDIEEITPKIVKLQQKFLHPNEVKNISSKCQAHQLTLIWSAKECLYKMEEQTLNFKKDMYIFPINLKKNYFYGSLLSDKNKKFKFYHKKLDASHLMVWT